MSARYFRGTSVLGPVKASTATCFKELVDEMLLCAPIGISHGAFLALDKKKRNEVKQVPFFTAAAFKRSPSKRVYAEATVCNLIFLDIDELPDGRCPAAPFVNNPDTLSTALGKLNFCAYITASSTAEKPRMRVVVEAVSIPLDQYSNAVQTVGSLLGLPSITKESSVAVQPMFLPTVFSDSADDDHPVIAHRTNGSAFELRDISDDFAFESSRENKHATNSTAEPTLDALDFLRAPVPEITLAIAKEALDTLDPNCPYPEWTEVATALKHQFSPHKEDEAFEIFDKWSEGGKDYPGTEAARKKWNSFRQSPIGRAPVTIRSLIHRAVLSGWDDKKLKEDCVENLLRWLEEGARSATELMEWGVKKIMAIPLMSAMQEDDAIRQLCDQAKSRFGRKISSTAVRKDLHRLKKELKSQQSAPATQEYPKWAKDVLFIANPQEFYRRRTGERYKTEGFNQAYGRHLLPTKEYLEEQGISVTPATLSTPTVQPAAFALNQLVIPTVYDYAYDPSQPTDVFFVKNGSKFVNTYTPTYPEPDTKHMKAAGEMLVRHIRNLVEEIEYGDILLDYLAYIVQVPGRKVRWAPMIQSSEGAGKGFLFDMMTAVLGREHVKVIEANTIKSGWNEWCFGRQLVVLDEIRVVGTSKHEIMNALKPLITNDDISVNEKFRNNRSVENITNYMIFSNHHDALALTPGDRRYFVIKSPLQSRPQVEKLTYFPALYKMLKEHPGAFRAFLLEREISPDFNPDGHAPRTKYVQDMIADTASDLVSAIRELLTEGDNPLVQYDIVSQQRIKSMLDIESEIRVSPQRIAHALREEGFIALGRHLIGEDRHYIWARRGIEEKAAVETARDRESTGKKNLSMELLFS